MAAKVMAWNTKFPPAAYFAEFAEVIPNGAERLFEQFLAESDHRRLLERRKQLFPLVTHIVGRVSALAFALAALGVAAVAIIHEAYWIAVLFGGGMIASVVTAFIKFSPDKGPSRKRTSSD
jgi:uncharacterized membrane protein